MNRLATWTAIGIVSMSPATLALPDFGAGLHEAVSEANPSFVEVNSVRATKRIHAYRNQAGQ